MVKDSSLYKDCNWKSNWKYRKMNIRIRFNKSNDAVGKTIEKGLPVKILIFNVEQLRVFFCIKTFHEIPSS